MDSWLSRLCTLHNFSEAKTRECSATRSTLTIRTCCGMGCKQSSEKGIKERLKTMVTGLMTPTKKQKRATFCHSPAWFASRRSRGVAPPSKSYSVARHSRTKRPTCLQVTCTGSIRSKQSCVAALRCSRRVRSGAGSVKWTRCRARGASVCTAMKGLDNRRIRCASFVPR